MIGDVVYLTNHSVIYELYRGGLVLPVPHRARKSPRTLQNKVRIKVFPEQLTLSINTYVALK